jgi:hypothetical protein
MKAVFLIDRKNLEVESFIYCEHGCFILRTVSLGLRSHGGADIDIPVLILGIDA